MVKKVVIPCVINGKVAPVEFNIGKPAEGVEPIEFQSKWLFSAKQGVVPPHITKAFQDLYTISVQNNMDFEDLCELAFNNKK